MAIKRTFWYCKTLDRGYNKLDDVKRVNDAAEANLIGSKTTTLKMDGYGGSANRHAPVLDIDFQAQLIPSSTPGHYHLYLDKEMSWWRYKRLLKSLYKAGIIEKGYYKGSLQTKQTLVRKPTIRKPPELIPSRMKDLHHVRLKELVATLQQLVKDTDPNPPKPTSKYRVS